MSDTPNPTREALREALTALEEPRGHITLEQFARWRAALSASPPPSGEYARGLEDAAKCVLNHDSSIDYRDDLVAAIRALLPSRATEPPR